MSSCPSGALYPYTYTLSAEESAPLRTHMDDQRCQESSDHPPMAAGQPHWYKNREVAPPAVQSQGNASITTIGILAQEGNWGLPASIVTLCMKSPCQFHLKMDILTNIWEIGFEESTTLNCTECAQEKARSDTGEDFHSRCPRNPAWQAIQKLH